MHTICEHSNAQMSLAILTAIKRKVTENDHILLQYALPQLYVITLYFYDLTTSVANVASSPVWAFAMLLLLITEN